MDSIVVILYSYGYNYLRVRCDYDVAPGGLLASVYHFSKIESGIDQSKEIRLKKKGFVPSKNSRIPSVFWVWKNEDLKERESYDMLGIHYHNHPHSKRILMPESWVGWPLRKDFITPIFMKYRMLVVIIIKS